MNRIERLSAIFLQLQSHSLVKAQQISERFHISIRTVYRDIRALEEAGIPIVGNPGVGYSLMDGFKLPPLMFTQEEALSFLIAEKLVNELTDSENSGHYQSGMEKIRSVMRSTDKKIVEIVESNLSVLPTHKPSTYRPDILLLVLQSIYDRKSLEISYFIDSARTVSKREVEPVGMFFSRTNWYLIAFCLRKMAYRTFRMDRVQHIVLLEKAQTRQHPPLKIFLDDTYRKENLFEVVIRMSKDKASMMSDDKYYYGLVSEQETGDCIEYQFVQFSLDKFARWYLSYADAATIVRPEALKEKVRSILQAISV